MIKRWSKFNESNSTDNFKSEVEKIRSYFVEFEDQNAISFAMATFLSNTAGALKPNSISFSLLII